MGKKKGPVSKEINESLVECADESRIIIEDDCQDAISHPLFCFPISEVIHTMRMQNGLRHNDSLRYRHYCSRRLSLIRRKLRFKHGRGRFVPRAIPNDFLDVRYLHIPLVCAERSWSFYLQLKSPIPTQRQPLSSSFKSSKMRRLAARRLAKAAAYASKLVSLAERHCDKTSILEARAYSAFISGVFATDSRHWRQAVEKLFLAQKLYLQLQRLVSGNVMRSSAITYQLTGIDPYIRTASYYLARQGINVAHLQHGHGANESISNDNATQLSETNSLDKKTDVSKDFQEVLWRGVPALLPESVLQASQYILIGDVIKKKITYFSEPLSFSFNFKSALYAWKDIIERSHEVQTTINNSLSLIHESLLASDETNNTLHDQLFVLESLARDWEKLYPIETNLVLLSLFLMDFVPNTFNTEYVSGKPPCSVSLIIHIADLVLELLQSVEKDILSTRPPTALQHGLNTSHELIQQCLIVWRRSIKDCRAFALCLLFKDIGKEKEAYVLMRRVVQRRKEYSGDAGEDAVLPNTTYWRNSPFSRVGLIIKYIEELLCLSSPLFEVEVTAALVSFTAPLSSAKPSISNTMSLSIDELTTLISTSMNFSKIPNFQPIPCKAIFMDLAFSSIEAPNIESKCSNTEKIDATGLVGRLASWWRK